MTVKRAVFLDKDGTVIKNVHYNADPNRVELVEHAGTALYRLQKAGFALIIVSNQSGVARGYFTEDELANANKQLRELLRRQSVIVDAIYYCPHDPEGTVPGYAQPCACRKPLPGMLVKAATEHNIHLDCSWMVGDILNDIEAGKRAGCRTVLVNPDADTLQEQQAGTDPLRQPHYMASGMQCAADFILSGI